MADQEFEEFTDNLDSLPSHMKGAASNYTLVPAITPLEENISFLEKVQLGEKLCGITEEDSLYPISRRDSKPWNEPLLSLGSANPPTGVWTSSEDDDDDDDDDAVEAPISIRWKDSPSSSKKASNQPRPSSFETFHGRIRRRKLPEIPKNRKPLENISKQVGADPPKVPASLILNLVKVDDLDLDLPCDVDSGNSTNHSPDDAGRLTASHSETTREGFSPISPEVNLKKLELMDPTHRGLHRFLPRHKDEIEIDNLLGNYKFYVQKEAEDLWCEGVNLSTGEQGIFPLAHVVDVEYNDFDPNLGDDRKERYLLDYLGSVESSLYKGNAVLCQAVRKIVSADNAPRPHTTVLEISDKGIKMVDKTRPSLQQTSPCHDYFYSLKNVTFCGFHPRDSHFFGFVTKHPRLPRYACHVFVSDTSTQHIAEGCGRAFSRFYKKFMDTAYPTEDIYLE
ncbi:MAPK8IP1 [Lepeophtheirus salmonis]|uniref:MAPK8IP1 n=1 Tax=Lepeophtheirus salmonis TaxID=72036 RepID=A0A7R8D345_LEPSM|nr:MAPK8IP1 [Lepeophtheirus salmonis]CAF3013119.1 MAPK8IP1 [Lepeophtheirus salmonis]